MSTPTLRKRGAVQDVHVDLDKPRTIHMGLNAVVLVEETMTRIRGVHTVWDDLIAGKIGATETRVILWAGLLHEDPDLTLAQVGEIFDNVGNEAINEVVDAVWQSQMAQKEEGDEEPDGAGPLPGPKSGASPESPSASPTTNSGS